MILCLIVSTGLISISANMELRGIFGPAVTADSAGKAAGGALAPPANTAAGLTDPAELPPASLGALRGEPEGRPNGSGAISIAKDLYMGRNWAGRLDVTVTASGDLMVDGRQLKELLAGTGLEQRGNAIGELGDGPADLRSLQRVGIDIRYSPEEDVFRINQ